MKSKFVMTNNAKNFISLVNNLLKRGEGVSGMALVFGEPGVGKSRTALWWVANNDNAIHIQVTHNMTPRWLLLEIVKELGEYPAARSSDLFNQIVKSLTLEPKILLIDEVDYLIDKYGFVEILRDIYDRTKTPIIMIGMGSANKKLERYPHLKDRILTFLRFKPFKLDEIDLFIKELSEVNFSSEAIEFLHKMKVGFRQIVNLVDRAEIIANANDLTEINLNIITKIFKEGD